MFLLLFNVLSGDFGAFTTTAAAALLFFSPSSSFSDHFSNRIQTPQTFLSKTATEKLHPLIDRPTPPN